MNNIYLDFDGTIVDVYDRYYSIFYNYFIKQKGIIPEFNDWKNLKIKRYYDHEIYIKFNPNSKINIQEYSNYKRLKLEDKEFLKLDTLILDPRTIFNKSNKYSFILLTQRKSKSNLIWQLNELKISNLFKKVIVVNPEKKNNKLNYLKKNSDQLDYIIGDSPQELLAGSILKIKSIHVNSGLFDYSKVSEQVDCESASNYHTALIQIDDTFI